MSLLSKTGITKALVKKVLEHPLDFDWTLQGLGMLRLYLSPEIRLHIWDDRYRVENVSQMHTHPWDFTSWVVVGEVNNYIYEEVQAEVGKSYFKQSIFCGKGGGLEGEPTNISLLLGEAGTYNEGDTYSEFADEIHISEPKNGTVTIIERKFREDVDHAFVYWEKGEWVSAEPRNASIPEILDITKNSLQVWF